MIFDLRIVTLGPSRLTYGVLAAAVVLACCAAWVLGQWHSPVGRTSRRARVGRTLLLLLCSVLLAAATGLSYLLTLTVLVPGACTYFVRPTGISLVVPVLVMLAGATSRVSWFPRARPWMVGAIAALVWVGTLDATRCLTMDEAYLEASRAYGPTTRQAIDHERARVVLPAASLAIPGHLDLARVFQLRSGARRADIVALIGTPSDEGADPSVVSQLVGVALAELDPTAFRYLRYLYADGSHVVFVLDACGGRVVSQVMSGATEPRLLDRMVDAPPGSLSTMTEPENCGEQPAKGPQ